MRIELQLLFEILRQQTRQNAALAYIMDYLESSDPAVSMKHMMDILNAELDSETCATNQLLQIKYAIDYQEWRYKGKPKYSEAYL